MAQSSRRRYRSYTRAEAARRLGMTETEVEARSLIVGESLGPLALPVYVIDPEERRQEIGRLIAEDIVRLQDEQTTLQALLSAYEERWERAGRAERRVLEATKGQTLAERADAFRERLARWEEAARELCRVYGLKAPPAAG